MSALKRLHEMQQRSRTGKKTNGEQSNESPSKRLKSSHTTTPVENTFASILDASSGNRKKLAAVTTNGTSIKSANKVDETRATIATNADRLPDGSDAINISSDEESDSEADVSNEEQAATGGAPLTNGGHVANGIEKSGQEMALAEDIDMTNGADEGEDSEPSFGDMLKARHPDVIDVHAQLPNPHAEPPHLEPASGRGALLRPLTGHSLATVLQQALKTNDKDMLESCFNLRDLQAIRNTVQRLPSPLVGALLTRISERIYKRPGRTGIFLIWIQWSLVAHGGYLATHPDILRKLKALNQVVRQRAEGLQPLVQLKAKLDMLNAQLELRRGVHSQRLRADATAEKEDVLYIEGDNESGWQSDNDEVLAIEAAPKAPQVTVPDSDEEADDFNPVQQADSAEEEDEDDREGMLDIEAEETDDDDGDDGEDEVEDSDEASASEGVDDLDDDDDDDDSEDDESEEEVRAPQPKTLNRKR